MRWKQFPEKEREFEDDICDVEDGQKPLVIVAIEMKLFGHSRDDGVTDVTAIKEGKHVYEEPHMSRVST